MKVQVLVTTRRGDVVLDFVRGDLLTAQVTLNSCPISGIDASREHDGQTASLDVLLYQRPEFVHG